MLGVPKVALFAGSAIITLALIWMLAKAVLPFAIGVACGAAALHFWRE